MKTLRQLTAEREALARREDRLTAQIQRKIATEARKALQLQIKLQAAKDAINAALSIVHPDESWTAEDMITRAGQHHITAAVRYAAERKAEARTYATEESPVVEPAPTRPKKFALHPVTPAERARSTAHLCDYIFGAFLSDKGAAKLRELLAAKELSEDEGALLTYLRSF